MRRTYFRELEGFARAIHNLPKSDPLTRELFAKDDDARIDAAKAKRSRKAEKRLREQKR